MKIGVELAYGFGDCLFGVPTIKAIAEEYKCKVDVAVQAQCADAFLNLEFVNNIIHIGSIWDGITKFQELRYNQVYQLTPQTKFAQYKEKNDGFSLIDASKYMAKDYGVELNCQRPIICLTDQEKQDATGFIGRLPKSKPIVAIEGYAKSGQTWADLNHIMKIVDKWRDRASIIWCSHTPSPDGTINMANYSRRTLIGMLHACDYFYNVGSGFFCASLTLDNQPKKNVSLWQDHYYKYIGRIAELDWQDITWVQNIVELDAELQSYNGHF